jgi:two-component system chemotaxis response regulator CheY
MDKELPAAPRVLLVDDSIIVRQVLAMTLRQLPEFLYASIEEAGNGAVALRKLETSRYDLILSDIRMPLLDGLELVRRVRQDMGDLTTPIVLISTLGTDEDIKRGLEAGATAYIRKPLSPHHIKVALQELIARQRFGRRT